MIFVRKSLSECQKHWTTGRQVMSSKLTHEITFSNKTTITPKKKVENLEKIHDETVPLHLYIHSYIG